MTIAAEVKQTMASLKGVQQTLKAFAMLHPEQQSKDILEFNINKIEKVIANIEGRIKQLEYEEPQYRGF
ncbi:DUF1657 domain-containing protein [Peptococcaceae bacterium 1198_IL3148]